MAKIRHNNFIDTVSGISENATEKGVMQLYTEGEHFDGRFIRIKGKDLHHFGTTGYLGLEQDVRLKEAAVDAIWKYGTQFPLSKTFVSFVIYQELEEKLRQMYGVPVVVTKNSTLGHLGVIPTVVRDEDAIVLDHQVHWSVQNATQIAKTRGIPVEMIRHSHMEMLEDRIRKLSARHSKIWYLADGIYSMYGDVAPINDLVGLCEKYPQLHLYFDDVHGMSWVGKNGTGFAIDALGKLEDHVVVMTTLSKTFGASGATMVTSNKEFYTKVKNFGGPLTFSAQLEPASVAAASASASIHLSDEIYLLQSALQDRVAYCNQLIRETDLPLIQENNCPVFYIGAGPPAVGYNINKKLLDSGHYVNMGIFPAVPVKQSGVRFTISLHNEKEDIKALITTMEKLYPEALEEEMYSQNQVRKVFGLPLLDQKMAFPIADQTPLKLQMFDSACSLDGKIWDSVMGGQSVFDHKGLAFLQMHFGQQLKEEDHWKFLYFLVTDSSGKPILATFFTYSLWKDDIVAPASVSEEVEAKRKENPYYLTTKVLAMGSLFTEGDHLYLDRSDHRWKEALDLLLHKIEELDEELNPGMIALRDFEENDQELQTYFDKKGFVKMALPDSCVLENLAWHSTEEYISSLSSRSRRHFRKEIEAFIPYFEIEIKEELTQPEIDHFYELYRNVWKNNLAFNTFPFDKEIFRKMSEHPCWEFIVLKLKKEISGNDADTSVGIMFCYKNQGKSYVPAFIGMDYRYAYEYNVYRQLLFQTILRAKALSFEKVDFGLSASFEKRKVGATIIPKVGYVQAKDNYTMEMLGAMQMGG